MKLLRAIGRLLGKTFLEGSEDKLPQLSAAAAFYTILSLAPTIVIALRVSSTLFGEDAARGELERQVETIVGEHGGRAVQEMIVNAARPASGGWATGLSLATLLFAASTVFAHVQSTLNAIWDVRAAPGRGWMAVLRARLLGFAMVVGVCILLVASLALSAVLAYFRGFFGELPQVLSGVTPAIDAGGSVLVAASLFGLVFKLLPNVRLTWGDVWPGAVVTAVLFTIGKTATGVYLGYSTLASSYGVAGSLVVLLVWIYFSALIFFYGAELTQVYAKLHGSRSVPFEAQRIG